MTRDTILEEVLAINSNAILLQLGTGLGKTRLAIEKTMSINCETVLVVAPTHPIINGWKEEFINWGYEEFLSHVTFCCYASLDKYLDEEWDMVICDEGHHLSERCTDILQLMSVKNIMILSATMNKDSLFRVKRIFPDLYTYRIGMRTTIDEGILPDPTIILFPLQLNHISQTCILEINPKATKVYNYSLPMDSKTYWKFKKEGNKNMKYVLKGTPLEYYKLISTLIEFYKKKGMYSELMKNKWLKMSGDRLKWLARQKNNLIPLIINKFKKERTLTFCCDIEQSEKLGPNSIHSKKKNSLDVLDDFNTGKINHIQACLSLDEGVNLVNCRIGIFANINSSERIITQRNGRILRHPNPIIILPYFKNTREEELVIKMMENYNKDLIKTITNINDLKV